LLILRHPREVEREWLASTLWPDSAQSQALYNLRQSLSNLRQALGTQAYRLLSPTPHGLRLDLTDASVDLLAFDAAIAQATREHERGVSLTQVDHCSLLQQALSLYRGPLLEGCVEEWVFAERQAREAAYLQALERLAALAMTQEDKASAIAALRQLIATDPLRESAHRTLMQALAVSGDLAASTLVYRDLRLLLHRELNAEPDPQTIALYHQLRIQARTGNLPSVSRTPPTTQSLTPNTQHQTPKVIPRPLTRLIGREEQVEQITTKLASARLLTLIGAGGVGKSRLGMAVAEAMVEECPGGVWFVRCRNPRWW
jgi:DNA-binding SARP family transcriptional activator